MELCSEEQLLAQGAAVGGGDAAAREAYTVYEMAVQRSSRVLAVSVPPEAAAEFERIAADEGRNRSELFRQMLRVYRSHRETQEFESLQRYGAARARGGGIRDEQDVDRLIAEARRG